ncbi:hypothetical protein ES703_57387 [subsurface metagenome]
MELVRIEREDLENLFSELVRRGEAVEKDRDKFITKGLDNLQKRGRNIKKKIMNALKATLNPNREEIKKLNKSVNELMKDIPIKYISQGNFKIYVSYAGSNNEIVVVTLHGVFYDEEAPYVEEVIRKQLSEKHYKIIVHLPYCDHLDSVVWGEFIYFLRDIRQHNGDLVLADMSPHVHEVYELMEFSSILKSYDSLNEAIAGFSTGQPGASKPAIQKPAPKAEHAPAQARKPEPETGKPETAPRPGPNTLPRLKKNRIYIPMPRVNWERE